MATVVITISDDTPGEELTMSMEFTPSLIHNERIDDLEAFRAFIAENPATHVAAFHAWRAIDEFMHALGAEPNVTAMHNGLEFEI